MPRLLGPLRELEGGNPRVFQVGREARMESAETSRKPPKKITGERDLNAQGSGTLR